MGLVDRSFLRRALGRLTKLTRPLARRLRGAQDTLARGIRRLPLPEGLRRALYRFLPWRPWTTQVPVDKVLLGAQNGLSAAEFASASKNLLWPSTPVGNGPHAALLRAAAEGALTDADILDGPYGHFAHQVIRHTGNFFDAVDDAGIVRQARRFLDASSAERSTAEATVEGRSRPGSSVRASKIRDSDCFQLIDGHHRAATSVVNGDSTIVVRASWLKVSTPLQELLDRMTWIGGQKELYQPLAAPELAKAWTIVRKCTDRQSKMEAFIRSSGVMDTVRPTYLDVASCYGWFVAQMLRLGLDAYGVERDPLAPKLGLAAYGLSPERITTADAIDFLSGGDEPFHIVSCLSLLHHFALGRAAVDEVELIRLLDRNTSRILFFETGQSHEEWLRGRLAGWDTEGVRAFLERETTFDEIVDLGPDEDAVPPYEANYGRHLFACVRHPAR